MTTNPTIETPTGTSSSSGMTDQAKETAATAADEAKHVAQAAGDQVRGLMDEARTQVQDQSRTQRDKLVELLRSFTDELEQMSQERSGMAAQAARQVADQTRSLEQRIDGREPSDLLEDVRAFARRRPGAFLVGAGVAGVLVGRLLRGAKDANASDNGTQASPAAGWTGTTAGAEGDLGYERPSYAGGYTTGAEYDGDPLTGAPVDPTAPRPAPGTTGVAGSDLGRPGVV